MGLPRWVAGTFHAYRRVPVLKHCARILMRLLSIALRLPVWLSIALLLLPHLAAVLVTSAFELLMQCLLRIDERLSDHYERLG